MDESKTRSEVELPASKASAKQLAVHERLLLSALATGMVLWCRTLRFRLGSEVKTVIEQPPTPSVIILWHNRLFAAPELFRRHFRHRRLAALISASRDGAWLSALLLRLKIRPIRGSRYRRGSHAFRELLEAHGDGFDLAITPDGSRGPCYEMKPGALAAARKCKAPIMLLSLNFHRAWRLRSWDGFHLPYPGSRIDVHLKVVDAACLEGDDSAVISRLSEEMNAITIDRSPLPRRPAKWRSRDKRGA